MKPNLKAFKTDIGILSTNSRGIRGEAEYTYNPPRDKTRILILGDSYTLGNEVSNTETYSYNLQQMLPDTEVINMGVSGYGHDQMLLYLKEEGIKYKPNIVIVGFVADDMNRNMLEFRDYAKPKFELVNNELKLTNHPVPPPAEVLQNEFYKLKFFDLLVVLYQKIRAKFGLDDTKRDRLTEGILDDIIKTVKSIGAIPVFVYLPSVWEIKWDDDHIPRGLPLSAKDFFFRYCKERDVKCLSVRQYFFDSMKTGRKFNPEVIRHYDANEHQLIAETIKNFLLDKQLILSCIQDGINPRPIGQAFHCNFICCHVSQTFFSLFYCSIQ